MAHLELPGLPGDNPLGFLAALGAQAAVADASHQAMLAWSDELIPIARLETDLGLEEVVCQVLSVAAKWHLEPAMSPEPEANDIKFPNAMIRDYLLRARTFSSSRLAMALVAEGSLDSVTGKVAKPTDFHFTAGRQLFLKMARDILEGVTADDLLDALRGPWPYASKLPSLRWDVADDRAYALSAFDPTDNTNNPKLTNPGAECLALLGLSLFPVFPGRRKTATTGCGGTWRNGWFSWPLWDRPATPNVVRTLVSHVSADCLDDEVATQSLPSLSVFRILESSIRRNDRAMGLANFGPAVTAWRRG